MEGIPAQGTSAPDSLPSVSVIVPVLNDQVRIAGCIEALLDQTYPRELVEIIVVDNGSQDETRRVVHRYPVTLLVEDHGKSPYRARNAGICHSRGRVIALTDASCTAAPDWIERGMHCLDETGADLVGGRFVFTFSTPRRAGESFDSLINLEMKKNIRERGVAKTGNLFFRRSVVERIGLFPDDWRSGGDVGWTGRATRSGCRIAYAADAVVHIPARGFLPLMKKQYRVGKGQPLIWRDARRPRIAKLRHLVLGFLPFPPSHIRRLIRERGLPEMESQLLPIWWVGWLSRVVTNAGRIHGLVS